VSLRFAGPVLVLLGCASAPPIPLAPEPEPAPAPIATAEVLVQSSVEGAPQRVVRQTNYLIEFGEHALEVDPTDGGRIVSFSLAGRSVVVPREESPEAYGSSFWPSPQSDWNWPPPLALDKAPWNASIDHDRLVLSSGTDERLGISAVQRIWAEPSRGAIVIEHVLVNRGSAPRRIAPWQNTRVRPRGLTFFPSQAPPLADSALKLVPESGVVWFRHDPAAHTQGIKGFADGSEGWLAHVDDDLLFVKIFDDVPRSAQAPKEAEIEIYVDGAGRFVEVEQQGAYAELAPGASSTWPVRWLLRPVPRGISVEPGSAELLAYVRKIVAELG
jgi:hypothetical protein